MSFTFKKVIRQDTAMWFYILLSQRSASYDVLVINRHTFCTQLSYF